MRAHMPARRSPLRMRRSSSKPYRGKPRGGDGTDMATPAGSGRSISGSWPREAAAREQAGPKHWTRDYVRLALLAKLRQTSPKRPQG